MIVGDRFNQRTTTPLFKVINWGKVIHTGSKSSCDVYISKRVIVDISCIVLLVKHIRIKYLAIDFKQNERWNTTNKRTSLRLLVVFHLSCLLGARARTSKQEDETPPTNVTQSVR